MTSEYIYAPLLKVGVGAYCFFLISSINLFFRPSYYGYIAIPDNSAYRLLRSFHFAGCLQMC